MNESAVTCDCKKRVIDGKKFVFYYYYYLFIYFIFFWEELGVDGQMEFGLKFLDEHGFAKNKMISGCFLFSFFLFHWLLKENSGLGSGEIVK